MYRGPFPRLALCISAVLVAGCTSESTTGPRIVSISAVSGLGQSGFVGGVLTEAFVVRAADQNDNPVEGAIVEWSVVTGGGTVSPTQSVTGSDGLASTSLRLGSLVGQQTVKATLGNSAAVTFSAGASAAPVSQLITTAGDNQTGVVKTALPLKIVIKTADAFGNIKTDIPVTFQVTAGGGTVNHASAVSDSLGLVTVDWTLGPVAGQQRLTATSGTVAPLTIVATAIAAAPAQVVILGGNNQSGPPGARLPDSLVVRVVDGFDNPVKDVVVDWTVLGDGGHVSPSTVKTDAAGRAAAAWTLGATGGPKAVEAKAGSIDPARFSAAGTIIFAGAFAGSRHTCGLDEGGVSYCWGYNGDGQLGIGDGAAGSGPVFALPQPTAAAGQLTFGEVSGGRYHSCALTLSNIGYCWGANVDGRLGTGSDGGQENSPKPLGTTEIFRQISAGRTSSCALTPTGRLFCWGANSEGQAGIGPLPGDPVTSPHVVALGTAFVSAAVGGLHACAVATTGQAYCWGYNGAGQLGNSTNTGSALPSPVSGSIVFASITAGENHTCGLTAAGKAYCWGDDSFGQLGDGAADSSATPVAVAGGLSFVSISAGFAHTCGVTSAGVAYCWGRNTHGELGDGTTVNRSTPVAVGGGLSFRMVNAGGGDAGINPALAPAHTCGITTGRVAYCWGDNQFGQLGDGSQVMRVLPTKVAFQP